MKLPARHRISPEHNLVLLEVWGSITDIQMLQVATQIWDNPAWRPGMNHFNDFRRLEEMVVELSDMRSFVEEEQRRMAGYDGPEGRVAVVVTSDIHEAGLKLYGALSRGVGHATQIFRAMRPAVAWIGVDPRQIWPGYENEPVS
jgi:hypothetical protein